jgi:hypothetical protein
MAPQRFARPARFPALSSVGREKPRAIHPVLILVTTIVVLSLGSALITLLSV